MNRLFYSLRYLLFAFPLIVFYSCQNQPHFLSDNNYRRQVEADFLKRKSDVSNSQIFAVFRDNLNTDEREALSFLYAYMPLSDMANNSGEFILKNVRYAFKAKYELPWGDSVPEREFRHFVLPIRINNEDLDSSRWIFYDYLLPRMKDLSMRDAVTEICVWCREHVSYKPSYDRSLSPLSLLSSAQGNLNELSVFMISALRSMCIPARLVYFPEQLQINSNSSMIEVWHNDKWHLINPINPEYSICSLSEELDSCNFSMNTRSFGYYDGPEKVVFSTPLFTEINVSDFYAKCDSSVVLSKKQIEKIHHRFAAADSVRNAYISTFFTKQKANIYCFASSYPFEETTCTDKLENILVMSRDNSSSVINFIFDESDHKRRHPEDICDKVDLLSSLSEKDMCDVTFDVLHDHYFWADDIMVDKGLSYDIISKYIRSPRVSDEKLTAYRNFFLENVHPDAARSFRNNPSNLTYWVNYNISIDPDCNINASSISPRGVWNTRIADSHSRDIFFVALARSFGIPSRIDSISGRVQIVNADGSFSDVVFEVE